jgi:hypothetical protein
VSTPNVDLTHTLGVTDIEAATIGGVSFDMVTATGDVPDAAAPGLIPAVSFTARPGMFRSGDKVKVRITASVEAEEHLIVGDTA